MPKVQSSLICAWAVGALVLMIHPCSSLQRAGSKGQAGLCSSRAVLCAVPPCSIPHYGTWPKQLPGQPRIPAVQPSQPPLAASFPVTRRTGVGGSAESHGKALARPGKERKTTGMGEEHGWFVCFVVCFFFFLFPSPNAVLFSALKIYGALHLIFIK